MNNRTIPIWHVDSFTTAFFNGNPAGVCLLPKATETAWMQSVASEMNLPATAFLSPRKKSNFTIRWFSPSVEIPLCGHATLASAHVLWSEGINDAGAITFHSHDTALHVDQDGQWIRMNFPALPLEATEVPNDLADILGAQLMVTFRNQVPAYLVELRSEAVVRDLKPDMHRLRGSDVQACIVTARSTSPDYDFVSRFFTPKLGFDEDHVTGTAHCSLGPYWANLLGKTDLVGCQVSRRGGIVGVRACGDRVDLLGKAVTVMRSRMQPC